MLFRSGITISEAIYDGQSLYITYKVESKDAFKYIKDDKFPNVVNNQMLPLADIKLSFTDEKIIERNGRIEGKFIDDHTFIGVGQYDLIDLKKPIPNEFEFITTINALAIENMSSDGASGADGRRISEDGRQGHGRFPDRKSVV